MEFNVFIVMLFWLMMVVMCDFKLFFFDGVIDFDWLCFWEMLLNDVFFLCLVLLLLIKLFEWIGFVFFLLLEKLINLCDGFWFFVVGIDLWVIVDCLGEDFFGGVVLFFCLFCNFFNLWSSKFLVEGVIGFGFLFKVLSWWCNLVLEILLFEVVIIKRFV